MPTTTSDRVYRWALIRRHIKPRISTLVLVVVCICLAIFVIPSYAWYAPPLHGDGDEPPQVLPINPAPTVIEREPEVIVQDPVTETVIETVEIPITVNEEGEEVTQTEIIRETETDTVTVEPQEPDVEPTEDDPIFRW